MPVYRVNFSGQMNIAANDEFHAVKRLLEYLDQGECPDDLIYCDPLSDVIEICSDEECDF